MKKAFDPQHYKTITREQWQTAAEAWHRWHPTLESWLGPATNLMLEMAEVKKDIAFWISRLAPENNPLQQRRE